MNTDRLYTVYEYDDITRDDIGDTAFKQLRTLILPDNADNEAPNLVADVSSCMSLYVRGGREIIRVKNYVGIISLSCGLTLEVLPKIPFGDNATARNLVLEMCKSCGKISYKHFQNADLHSERFTLFEIFIRMFIEEVAALYKQGLASGYVYTESNERFIKGKIAINENIKRNVAHGERFYVGYDEFSLNRAENRLIKSALTYLRDISVSDENRCDLRRLCLMFDGIDASDNIDRDFACCTSDRNVKRYADALSLCRVFLRKKSFTLYSGQSSVTSLLFPMEILYERYIACEMAKALPNGWALTPQSKGKYLYDTGGFALRPDIVIKKNGGEQTYIVDTKWKRLRNEPDKHYGISQADMYQMYAYHTRFDKVKRVTLLYPYYEKLYIDDYVCINPKVTVSVKFFDLKKYIEDRCDFFDCIVPEII